MQIRLACPNCRTELNCPLNAAGTRSKCPRCQCAFLIPIPTAEALPDKPSSITTSPTPPAVPKDETPIPEQLTRDRPRPIYKQTPPGGTDSSSSLKQHRSGRTRRKVKINQKPPINPAMIIGGVVAAVVLIVGLIVLIWNLTSGPKPASKPTNLLAGNSVLDDEPDPFDNMPKTYHMPLGWSKTDKEKTGFELFWPVDSKKAGYTNVENDLLTRGSPIDFWSCEDKAKQFTWSLQAIKLNEAEQVDIENKKNRLIEDFKRDGLNKVSRSERELDNRPTLLVTGIKKDKRTTMKIQWTKGSIWIAKVECPNDVAFGDSKVWNFLLSFKLEQ